VHDVAAAMNGFKESLTRVSCTVYPEEYLTLLRYSEDVGKREIARAVCVSSSLIHSART
jgi:hypothetical protein